MSEDKNWSRRIAAATAAASSFLVAACGIAQKQPLDDDIEIRAIPRIQVPERTEKPPVIIDFPKKIAPIVPPMPPKIVGPSDLSGQFGQGQCDEKMSDELAQSALHRIIKMRIFNQPDAVSDLALQIDLNAHYSKQREFWENIVGCETPLGQEKNKLVQAIRKSPLDFDQFNKLYNMMMIDHFADVADLYDKESLRQEVLMIGNALKANALNEILKAPITLKDKDINDLVDRYYPAYKVLRPKEHLAELLKVAQQKDVRDFREAFGKEVAKLIKEAVQRSLPRPEPKESNTLRGLDLSRI